MLSVIKEIQIKTKRHHSISLRLVVKLKFYIYLLTQQFQPRYRNHRNLHPSPYGGTTYYSRMVKAI